MYDPAPAHTGRRRRPAKHGKRLSVEADFTLSTEKEHGTKRLFFSTVFPENLQIFCACQENAPLNRKRKISPRIAH